MRRFSAVESSNFESNRDKLGVSLACETVDCSLRSYINFAAPLDPPLRAKNKF